jgi:uncharacterized protein YlxP (DUF503 family)
MKLADEILASVERRLENKMESRYCYTVSKVGTEDLHECQETAVPMGMAVLTVTAIRIRANMETMENL